MTRVLIIILSLGIHHLLPLAITLLSNQIKSNTPSCPMLRLPTSKTKPISPRSNSMAAMRSTSRLIWRLCNRRSGWLRNAWISQSRPTITKTTPMVLGKRRPKWGPNLGPTKAVLVANQGMGRPLSGFNLGWAYSSDFHSLW